MLMTNKTYLGEEVFRICSGHDWMEKAEFEKYIYHEKGRAERTNSPVSHVIITLYENYTENSGSASHDNNHLTKMMILTINQLMNSSNMKCIQPGQLDLLLLDTSLQDAKNKIDELFQRLFVRLSEIQCEKSITRINSIEISSYPVQNISEYTHFQGIPSIMDSQNLTNRNHQCFNKQICFDIIWKVKNLKEIVDFADSSLLIRQTTYSTNFLYKYIKRLIDILGSIFLIVLSSPVMLIIAILVKMSSKGPVLYSQKRIGYLGKEFSLLKFRSMVVNNDDQIHKEYVKKLIKGETEKINQGDENNPVFKLKDDPRITPVGRFIRSFSLDEFPQFFNVLKGDMSLVGPRPPLPYEVTEYNQWHYRRIFDVKPGITGLWQVSDRSRLTFDEMVRLDIYYSQNWSFLLDLKILLNTFKAVLGSEGL
jgi:lipopolysaccharide/colanic/teichoic acid biosynthesis glycosyltransferase